MLRFIQVIQDSSQPLAKLQCPQSTMMTHLRASERIQGHGKMIPIMAPRSNHGSLLRFAATVMLIFCVWRFFPIVARWLELVTLALRHFPLGCGLGVGLATLYLVHRRRRQRTGS